jgi:hypothetical protein
MTPAWRSWASRNAPPDHRLAGRYWTAKGMLPFEASLSDMSAVFVLLRTQTPIR